MNNMKYGKIAYLEKKVSRLVHGTMMLDINKLDDSITLLDDMLALGVNTFDTAPVYGTSESVLGKWLEIRQNRNEVVVLSKCSHQNAYRKRVTPYDIYADFEDSLAKLKTDYIDIYILHRDNPAVPVGPIVETLNNLYAAGKINSFGGSNWTHQRISEANEYAYKYNLIPMTVSSPNYSLAEQVENPWGEGCVTLSGTENKDARKWYDDNNMPIFSYSSLGRGFFSGRVKSNNPKDAENILDDGAKRGYMYPENFERLRRAEILAKEKGLSVPQIATAWIMSQSLNVYALVGANNKSEMQQNIEALNVKLSKKEIDWLNLVNP